MRFAGLSLLVLITASAHAEFSFEESHAKIAAWAKIFVAGRATQLVPTPDIVHKWRNVNYSEERLILGTITEPKEMRQHQCALHVGYESNFGRWTFDFYIAPKLAEAGATTVLAQNLGYGDDQFLSYEGVQLQSKSVEVGQIATHTQDLEVNPGSLKLVTQKDYAPNRVIESLQLRLDAGNNLSEVVAGAEQPAKYNPTGAPIVCDFDQLY